MSSRYQKCLMAIQDTMTQNAKKLKSDQLSAEQLKSHSEALYGLLLKPVINHHQHGLKHMMTLKLWQTVFMHTRGKQKVRGLCQ